MQIQSNSVFGKILPFIGMGIFLVVIIIALVLLSYVLLIGGAIGLILFCIAYLKRKFFPNKYQTPMGSSKSHEQIQSRMFDNDDFK